MKQIPEQLKTRAMKFLKDHPEPHAWIRDFLKDGPKSDVELTDAIYAKTKHLPDRQSLDYCIVYITATHAMIETGELTKTKQESGYVYSLNQNQS